MSNMNTVGFKGYATPWKKSMEVVLKLCVTWTLGQFKEIQWFWVRLTGWGKSTHDSIDERRRGEEEVLHSSRPRQGFWSLPGAYHPNRLQIFRSNQRLHGAGFLEVCALHVSWGCPSLPLYEINVKYLKPWAKPIKPETNQIKCQILVDLSWLQRLCEQVHLNSPPVRIFCSSLLIGSLSFQLRKLENSMKPINPSLSTSQ